MTQRGSNLSAWGKTQADSEPASAEEDAALPDLKPWSQAGWIFRDGDCVAIERQGDELDGLAWVLAD